MGKKRKRNQLNSSITSTSPNFSNVKQTRNQFPRSLQNGRQLTASYSSGASNHNFNRQGGPFVEEVSSTFLDSFPLSNNSSYTGTLGGNSFLNHEERLDSTYPFNSDSSPQMNNQTEQMEMMRAEILELKRKLKSMEDAQNRAKYRNLSMETGRNWVEERDFMCMETSQSRLQNRNLSMEGIQNGQQNGNFMYMQNSPTSLQNRNFSRDNPQRSPQNLNCKPREPTSLAELLKDVPYIPPFSQIPKAAKQLKSFHDSMPVAIKKTNLPNKQAQIKSSTNTVTKPASKAVPHNVSKKPAYSNNMPTKGTNKAAFSNNMPAKVTNKPAFSNNMLAKATNNPSFSNSMLSNASNKPAFSSNMLAKASNKPAFSSNMFAKACNKPAFSSNMLAKASNKPAFSSNMLAKASNKPAFSSNMLAKASNKPVFSNNMPAKAGNQTNSNTLPLQRSKKSRKKAKKSRNAGNNLANVSNTMPIRADSASKFNKQNNRQNLAKSAKPLWKTHMRSGPLPLTQFSSELGIVNSSSGQPNKNWIQTDIYNDGLLPTPRLYQSTNLGQDRYRVDPHQSTLPLTEKNYESHLSEDYHNWLLQADCTADLSFEFLQIKQQNVEDQLNELDKRSQEMEQNLSLLQNEYFPEF